MLRSIARSSSLVPTSLILASLVLSGLAGCGPAGYEEDNALHDLHDYLRVVEPLTGAVAEPDYGVSVSRYDAPPVASTAWESREGDVLRVRLEQAVPFGAVRVFGALPVAYQSTIGLRLELGRLTNDVVIDITLTRGALPAPLTITPMTGGAEGEAVRVVAP